MGRARVVAQPFPCDLLSLLWYVFPCFPRRYFVGGRQSNAKFAGQLRVGMSLATETPQLRNHCFGHNRLMMCLASFIQTSIFSARSLLLSPLCVHVRIIVCTRTKKHVIWVDAGRRVASMKDAHSMWNRTAQVLIGQTMRLVCAAPFPKYAIPFFIQCGLP